MELQGAPNIQNNTQKGEYSTQDSNIALRFPYFKTYYKATEIKTVLCWHKARHINQWTRTESPEVKSYMHDQLIFNKSAKFILWGKEQPFKQVLRQLVPLFITYTEINAKMDRRPNY